VFVENHGNVDVTDVNVTLTAGTVTQTGTIERIAADSNGFCTFALTSSDFEAGTVTVTATVEDKGEAAETLADNTYEAEYNVATAIDTVKAQFGEDVDIHTINGTKVSNMTKGLYIVNGRKVVVK